MSAMTRGKGTQGVRPLVPRLGCLSHVNGRVAGRGFALPKAHRENAPNQPIAIKKKLA